MAEEIFRTFPRPVPIVANGWREAYAVVVSIEQIKAAIEQLSLEQRAELAAWLHGWKDDDWDEQTKRDVAEGRLDDVVREVEDDVKAGRLRDMP